MTPPIAMNLVLLQDYHMALQEQKMLRIVLATPNIPSELSIQPHKLKG